MEEEAEKIKAMQSEVEKQMSLNASSIGKFLRMSSFCSSYLLINAFSYFSCQCLQNL